MVKGIVEERAVELGEYIIAHKETVRGAAKKFGVSKSTVHMDGIIWNGSYGKPPGINKQLRIYPYADKVPYLVRVFLPSGNMAL